MRIFEWLKFWKTSAPQSKVRESETLYYELRYHCPECGVEPDYYEGPCGGMNINIFCGHCGQGYNVCEIAEWAERIHKDKRYIRKQDDNL